MVVTLVPAAADTGSHNFQARGTLLHGSARLTSGPSSVEDHPSFRERDFAVAGQDYRRPVNLGERQIRLSSPRWEDATRIHSPPGMSARAVQGQCRSPSSHPQAAGSGNELVGI